MNNKQINVAIIGCGAVAERCHLPPLLAHPDIKVGWLVDASMERARTVAKKVKNDVDGIVTDYKAIIGRADAAVLALPHSLHEPVSTELLRNGVHVLVEKPMAMSSQECDSMIDAAEQSGAVLAVGLMRRFIHAGRFAKWALTNNIIGQLESFDFREGNVYNWPVTSDFFFRKETAGGGVLFDTGAHTLDQLMWWLGDVASFEYFDDNFGGVEADCLINLTMESGVKGIVELSRTRNLRNTAVFRGTKGELEVNLRANEASISMNNGEVGLSGAGIASAEEGATKQGFLELFHPQIDNWIEAIQTKQEPAVSGREARRSVALIEACYQNRKDLELPWVAQNELVEATDEVTSFVNGDAAPLSTKESKINEMRNTWNGLSKQSKLGFIAHLKDNQTWNLQEFHLAGVRFVDQMIDRFEDYGETKLSHSTILEIGCGVGRFLKPLACHFRYVIGVDISEEMLKVANENCSCLPNIETRLNHGSDLPGVEDNSLDYCVSAGVFQHITHIEVIISYIREAIRVLKPGGTFLFQFEANKFEPIGSGQVGARVSAEELDNGLAGLPYKIREASIDPDDPVRNMVIVLQKLKDGEIVSPEASSFSQAQLIERPWITGVYEDIKTQTTMHDKLKEAPRKLTFFNIDTSVS